MSDQFNVSATITPANPSTGQTVTVTISGDDVHTEPMTGTLGPLTLTVKNSDNTEYSFTVPAVPCTVISTTHESVKLVSVSDPTGRVWNPSVSGLAATATV